MERTKHVLHYLILFDTYFLDSLRIVCPQSAIFTAIEKQHTSLSENEISSDNNVRAYEEVSSCLLTESPSTASIHERDTLDLRTTF